MGAAHDSAHTGFMLAQIERILGSFWPRSAKFGSTGANERLTSAHSFATVFQVFPIKRMFRATPTPVQRRLGSMERHNTRFATPISMKIRVTAQAETLVRPPSAQNRASQAFAQRQRLTMTRLEQEQSLNYGYFRTNN
jgi:hypothetical protein